MSCGHKTYSTLFNFSNVRKNVIYQRFNLKDEEIVTILIHDSLRSGRALTGIPQLTLQLRVESSVIEAAISGT
jgi:hypothetical protein